MSISPTSGGQASKDQYFQNLIMYRNGKLDSLWGSMLPKICITSKKGLNKSCSELNFVQKSPWDMSISPTSGVGRLQRSVHLKSYNVQKQKSPQDPLPVETDICAYWLFCTKFKSEQLSFEASFDVMRIFGSVDPKSESNFPFLYIIRFQIYWSLELPSSTRGGDRHMRLGTFLYKIQFRTTFILSFFWRTAYFWHHWAPKWI